MSSLNDGKILYVVRLWDSFDSVWEDVSEPVSYEEALRIWNACTDNGTHYVKYDDMAYYKIYPSNTKMLFSD